MSLGKRERAMESIARGMYKKPLKRLAAEEQEYIAHLVESVLGWIATYDDYIDSSDDILREELTVPDPNWFLIAFAAVIAEGGEMEATSDAIRDHTALIIHLSIMATILGYSMAMRDVANAIAPVPRSTYHAN